MSQLDSLVGRLSTGKHKVILEPRSKDLKEIRERLKSGFVYVKFVETQTELGIDIVKDLTIFNNTQFAKIVGTHTLNDYKVHCVVEVDLLSRQGEGFLLLLDETTNSSPYYPNGGKQAGKQNSKNKVFCIFRKLLIYNQFEID